MESLELAETLAEIPSHDDEAAVGDYIERWLRDRTGATVTRDDAGNVVARRGPESGSTVALVGHHDVVPPGDGQTAADGSYVVERRDGRLYGRGTADMKGSLAAAMVAFRDADPSCELAVASFVGEEDGGVGCRAAIENGFAPEFAVVGEGSTGYSATGVTDVAIAHRGRRGATLVATGEAAHASEADAATNAIYRATDAVAVVRELDAPETRVFGERLAGSVTVTEIDGGEAWNVVPDRCTVTVDERTVPGERAALETAAVEGVTLDIEQDLPPMACSDDGFAETVLSAANAAQPGDAEAVTKPHATDAGWLASRAGTACVVCGAAEPGEAHTDTESVSTAAVERCADIYRRVAEAVDAEV